MIGACAPIHPRVGPAVRSDVSIRADLLLFFFDHGRAQPRSPADADGHAPEICTSIELQILAMHGAPLRTTPL